MTTRQIAKHKSQNTRLEFDKKTKIEMFKRAGGPEDLRCEGTGCGIPLRGKPFEYDHTLECWEMEDVEHGIRPPLTAEDGKLLCIPCHQEKTRRKSGERAHGKRIVEKTARATESDSPMPFGRKSDLKKRMNGDIVNRHTGEVVWRKQRVTG